MSLRRRLTMLVAVALTPPFFLMVFNTARWQVYLESDVHKDAVADARLVAAQIGQMINGGHALLQAMSKYPVVVGNDADCTNYFKSVITELPIFSEAAIIDTDGKFHCSTIPIPPDLDVRDRVYFREPLATGKFTVGAYTIGRVTYAPSIHLSMPYRSQDGMLSGVIVVILDTEKMADNLITLPTRVHDRIIVLDHTGAVVFAFPHDATRDAEVIAKSVFPRLTIDAVGTVDADILPNRPQIVAYVPIGKQAGGLFALIAVDRNVAMTAAWNIAAVSLFAGMIAVVLGIGGTWLVAHYYIVRPLRRLVSTARRREHGDTQAHFPQLATDSEFGVLSAALSRMSDKVDELLAQKELLLREVQHRVMNSLNVLSSIFDIQRRQHFTTDVTREQLDRARDRVMAMAAIYRFLYSTSTMQNIDVGELLRAVCKESENAYEGPVKLDISVESESVMLSGSNAISLAMLTHELITNAIKHAYAEGEPGPISVSLKRLLNGSFEYHFADRGRGLPADFQIEKSDSLGMNMIAATARQLNGKLKLNDLNPGTEFVLQLPSDIEQATAA
jgi:two-component sensor histidine kinase